MIEKIRQKIEQLRREVDDHNYYLNNSEQALGYSAALDDIWQFLDTLSEEDALPCWKKVHTYTEELREGDMEKMLLDLSIGKGKRKTKIALPDRVVDALSEEPDKSLEEEISRTYHDGSVTDTENIDHVAYDNIARHFAGWQARQLLQGSPMPEDTVLFNKGVAEGRRLEREDMLKDAVEANVTLTDISLNTGYLPKKLGIKYGDKVRIIILKEEE